MLGLTLYLTNFFFAPHWLALVPILVACTRIRDWSWIDEADFTSLFILVMLGCMIWVAGLVVSGDVYAPWFVLFLAIFLVQRALKPVDLEVIVWSAVLEALVVLVEYHLGVPSLFMSTEFKYQNSEFLYYSRPFGFSDNSSAAAISIFMGYLLLDFVKMRASVRWFAKLILLAGLVFTFTRAILVAVVCFELIKIVVRGDRKALILLGLAALPVLIFPDLVLGQLTRGGDYGLSGREFIWGYFFKHIENSPLLGAFGQKIFYEFDDVPYHAHNSFLEIVAVFGLPFSIGLMLVFLRKIDLRNISYVIPVCLVALFQYVIFWGFSFADVIFYFFVFSVGRLMPVTSNNSRGL